MLIRSSVPLLAAALGLTACTPATDATDPDAPILEQAAKGGRETNELVQGAGLPAG